jgi:glycosyltransferase involved in cell wall biosynthesis
MSGAKRKGKAETAGKRPIGIFVLGMHRSGTSVLTRILSLRGCALPGDLLGANESNPTGHWESLRAIEINDGLLYALGRRWDDIRELPADWMQRPESIAARQQIHAFLDREFSSENLWLLKDPRLCRLAPLWMDVAEAMGVDVRVIVPVRHPSEVIYSLTRRDGIGAGQGQLMWWEHLLEAEKVSRERKRVLVHFDEVVSDWRGQTDRIASELGISWPDRSSELAGQVESFINPELRHSDAADGAGELLERVTPAAPVAELYARLREADGAKAWSVIARSSEALENSASLFAPAISDLAQLAERNERRASAADAILADKLTGGGAGLLNEPEIRKLLHETGTILSRIDEVAPLGVELVRQIEVQRREFGADALARSAETTGIFERLEQSPPLLAELVSQIEAQRKELADATGLLSGESSDLRERMAQTGPLIVELIQQVDAQRTYLANATGVLSGENSGLREKMAQTGPLLVELIRQVEAQRAATNGLVVSVNDLNRQLEAERQANRILVAESANYATQIHSLNAQAQRLSTALAERNAALAATGSALETSAGAIAARDEMIATSAGAVAAREAALKEYREHAEALERARDALTRELHEQNFRLTELLNSRSWRLMAPFRRLRRLLPRKTPAAEGDRKGLLKSVYMAMPISWPMRLRLKSVAFHLLAPVIGNTDAYRRWQSQRGPARAFSANTSATQGRDSVGVAVRVERKGADPAKYVPLALDAVAVEELRAKLIAFYLPQFHPIPENDEWWGRGFTEWTNVSKALPQFDGHEQPHLPGELGFYDLRLPEVMERQIELARHYGVHGFCFHYYWFDGRRVLERPLEQFIDNPSFEFPFCICWANENWTRRWDGQENDILLGQKHTPESDLRFIKDIEPLLRDPRYIRVADRPVLIVYRPSLLPDCAATVERWREHCRDVGIGEILLVMVQFDAEDPRPFGFDVALEFPPHKLARNLPSINATLPGLNPEFKGYVIDYQAVVDRSKQWPVPEFDLIRGVFPGWDNEARKPQQGYLFAHSSPERYRDWLQSAVDYSRQHPVAGEALVFVNAWNEWAEGAYLEPDRRYGYAYLQATREALTRTSVSGDSKRVEPAAARRVAVVSHDAHPHGAQYLSINLCRELSRSLGWPVDAVLLGDGVLEAEFAEAATVHHLFCRGGTAAGAELARKLKASGVEFAIANTTVSGLFVSDLHGAGIKVISLVHELPGVIESMALQEHAGRIAQDADLVVFAADAVRQGFEGFARLDPARVLIRPQGLYKRNRFQSAGSIAIAKAALRERFGLPADALIVLSVGYADLRKGADLFVSIGERLLRRNPRIHMIWLGHPDVGLEPQLRAQIKASGFPTNFHFPGRDPDTDPYYAGCDLYALTSREDPFPTVIMEAFDVSVPVIAFAGIGGFDDLLKRAGGVLIPALDVDQYAAACASLLADAAARKQLGEQGKALVDREFYFPDYVRELLAHCGVALPKVSVVVPNYNYARYLAERLNSVTGQTLPPYEVIVLDDASTDDSLTIIGQLGQKMPLRVIANDANSGSVFRQWQRGVEAARGDFIWIAEADDLSEPDFLQKVMPAFDRADVVMSYCQSRQIDADGAVLCDDYLDYVADFGAERWRSEFVAGLGEELARGLAVKNTIPNVSAVVFRRETLAAVLKSHAEQIASYRIAGDWLTYLHVLENGAIAFHPEAMNRHRRHAAGVTIGADHRPHLDEVVRVQQWIAERFVLPEQTRQAAANYIDFLKVYLGLASDREELET